MKTKLTFSEKVKVFLAKKYLLNTNSGEVHYLPEKTKHCWIHLMNPKNKVFLSENEFQKALANGYNGKPVNGCRWCLRKHSKS